MKRIFASIPFVPLAYALFRFLGFYGSAWAARMKAADPLFPQTALEMLQKTCADLFLFFIPFLLMVAAVQLVFSRIWGYLMEREHSHYEAEMKK
jgi:hypothetical protein